MKLSHPELFNIDLAQRVLDHVERFPEQHNQKVVYGPYWSDEKTCGTVGCLAGWAAQLSGQFDGSVCHSVLAVEVLGLDDIDGAEFNEFFGTEDKGEAKEIFRDYIAQAQLAQYCQKDLVLV